MPIGLWVRPTISLLLSSMYSWTEQTYLTCFTINWIVSIDARSVKWISLVVLILQNSALILIMRYTRTSVEKDQLYLASTAVVMSEGLKTLTCLLVLFQLVGSTKDLGLFLRREVLHNSSQAMKLGIPALLYLIQVNYGRNDDVHRTTS